MAKQEPILDTIYCCKLCRAVFLFKSDIEDHSRMLGPEHAEMSIMPLTTEGAYTTN